MWILDERQQHQPGRDVNQPRQQSRVRLTGTPRRWDDEGSCSPETASYHINKKTLWTIKLGREHKSFQPLLKRGRIRPYTNVGSQEAVQVLITTGYDGLVLEMPNVDEKQTKVIIFDYPTWLDP